MVAKKVVLKNREGLHVRPTGLFSNEMQRFLSDVWVCHNESVTSGKSIMNLIAAGIQCGDEVELCLSLIHIWVPLRSYDNALHRVRAKLKKF